MNDRVTILQADAEKLPFPDKSVDLVFGSPPYCDARTYGIGAQRKCVDWVEWMLRVTHEAQRVSRGPVVWVAAGVTRKRNYWPACEGLMWEWWKLGGECELYRPCIFHRVGIPGSGGKDWFRADTEYVMCFKRPGPLPWSNNTAMGHPPRWAPGGAMSNRLSDGVRVGKLGRVHKGMFGRRKHDGVVSNDHNPKYEITAHTQTVTRRNKMGERDDGVYAAPALSNPGNVIKLSIGGGLMGHPLAHENEAPFPVKLAEWFVKSLCPPDGVVLDPFGGSGTTAHAAIANGRRCISSDIRENQCDLMRRRLASIQQNMVLSA